MRRRLTLTIVGLVTGALLLAGGGALLVASSTTRHDVVTQLLDEAGALGRNASSIRRPAMVRLVGRVLRVESADILVVGPSGRVVRAIAHNGTPLPLTTLPTTGGPWSGVRDNVAYAVVPVHLSASVARSLPPGDWTAVLLTRRVGDLAPHWGFFVVVTAGTAAVAAAVAAALARRITKPIAAASDVTVRIAGGQFEARVPVGDEERDELATLARSINAMAASLEHARRRETELLASVSHDLRTPLTSIRGYAEAIADDVTDAGAAARIITDQAQRLERLVGDLLDLARLRSHHLPLHPTAVDLAASGRQAIDAVGPEARRFGVSVALQVHGADPVARADPDRLAQVLTNLVQNAVAHAGSSVLVRVGEVPVAGSGWVFGAVEDDGPGIPAGELERVFDRFYQLDRGRAAQVGGSGLGLSIVAELVSAMGGTVRVESPVSGDPARPGSRFVVTLPGAAVAAPPTSTAGRAAPEGSAAPGATS
ncbi:MAG: sensor histidine kinase [Acidimicrobiales bacterium]